MVYFDTLSKEKGLFQSTCTLLCQSKKSGVFFVQFMHLSRFALFSHSGLVAQKYRDRLRNVLKKKFWNVSIEN